MRNRKLNRQNPHETLVEGMLKFSVSASSTFRPNLFRNGREPADLIIYIGRSIFAINMTKGRSYFEQLCRHNIQQAEDRLEEWKGGKPFRGENEWRKFHLEWADIDCICIISVVDGPHAACRFHEVSGLKFRNKVALCATLTTKVMQDLVDAHGGARELVWLCGALKDTGQLSEVKVRRMIRQYVQAAIDPVRETLSREPQVLGRAIINGKLTSWSEEIIKNLIGMRNLEGPGYRVFCDIHIRDLYEITAFIIETVALIEMRSAGYIYYNIIGTHSPIGVVVSSNAEGFNANISGFMEDARRKKCGAMVVVSLSAAVGVQYMIAMISEPEIYSIDMSLQAWLERQDAA